MKRVRLPVPYATVDEAARIRARARMHGVSVSRFLICSALGEQPVPPEARDAQEWWERRSPARKTSIFLYHSSPRAAEQEDSPDEPLPLFP